MARFMKTVAELLTIVGSGCLAQLVSILIERQSPGALRKRV